MAVCSDEKTIPEDKPGADITRALTRIRNKQSEQGIKAPLTLNALLAYSAAVS